MNNLKCKLLKALLGVSLGALGAVMESILLKHYDKIDRDQHL